jgi:hypothetical protein
MDQAFGWIKENGICTEADYPYTSGAGVTGTCQKSKCKPEVTLTGYTDVPKGDESALLKALNVGPVSIAIEADKSAFQLYNSGVLDSSSCGKELDHGVLIVGYGTDNGKDYWKVKNSWGPGWGEKGYIRLERGLPGAGECGIKSMSSYPEVKPLSPGPSPPAPTPASTPAPSPAPAPTPSPECEDKEIYCKVIAKSPTFVPSLLCPAMPHSCDQTCGCCGPSPKSWCKGAVSDSSDTIVV